MRRRYLRRTPFWHSHIADSQVHITTSLAELDAAIVSLRDQRVEVLAVLGGDGTLHHAVDALLRHYPSEAGPLAAPIVLALGGGTMNGVPRALGTRGRPEDVLRFALAALEREKPLVHLQHVLRISDARDDQTRYGFSFATGLVYRALEHYYSSRAPRLAAAVSASLLPFTAALQGGYDDDRIDVRANDDVWLAHPHTLVASVFERPLLWFRPFGATVVDNETFNLGATSLRPLAIVPRLWAIFRGRCRHPQLRVGRVRHASIAGSGGGYVIDGDLYPRDAIDVQITVGPPLRFLAASA